MQGFHLLMVQELPLPNCQIQLSALLHIFFCWHTVTIQLFKWRHILIFWHEVVFTQCSVYHSAEETDPLNNDVQTLQSAFFISGHHWANAAEHYHALSFQCFFAPSHQRWFSLRISSSYFWVLCSHERDSDNIYCLLPSGGLNFILTR